MRAEEFARVETNGPILWRIVCRARSASILMHYCTFIYLLLIQIQSVKPHIGSILKKLRYRRSIWDHKRKMNKQYKK